MVKRKTSKRKMATSTKTAKKNELSFAFLLKSLVGLLVANAVVVYVANMLFPNLVVLGTNMVTPFMGLMYSMGVLALIDVGAMPVIEYVSATKKMMLKDKDWMVIYWVINALGLWVVGRFAEILGLGLASWFVAVVLALVLDMVQGMVMMKMSK